MDHEKNRDRIKTELLIHDMKIPLAVVVAGVNSLLNRQDKYGPLTALQQKVLLRILRNARLSQQQVGDALELGRVREGVITHAAFSLEEMIRNALVEAFDVVEKAVAEAVLSCQTIAELKTRLRNLDVDLNIDEGLWNASVTADERKIRQITRNLLSNALKYRKRRVDLTFEIDQNNLVFTIADDGDGIPKAHHEEIFRRYFQMNADEKAPVRGHGLGLAGVLVLVEDLGGTLTLTSDTGQGAVFAVRLPISRPPQ